MSPHREIGFADYFTDTPARDLLYLFVGDYIGRGVFRDVYVCKQDPNKVVKVEIYEKDFNNIKEWEVWKNFEHNKKMNKLFAPCVDISPNGVILIQERTKPVDEDTFRKKLKQLPRFLQDIKPDNFGLIGNRLVCHDYGLFNVDERLRNVRKKELMW